MATTITAYKCAKCQHTGYETDEFRATGGNFAKIFDIQNKKFTTVSCKRCGYTEMYRGARPPWATCSISSPAVSVDPLGRCEK